MLIPRDVLEVHKVASKDPERTNLNCVHVERSPDPRLVATDGFRMVTVTWKEPEITQDQPAPEDYGDLTEVAGFICDMPVETCAELQRVVPKGEVQPIFAHAWLEETNEPGMIRAGAGERLLGQAVRCEAKRQEPDFPDWRAVRKVKGAVRIGINATYLAEVLRVVAKISGQAGVVLHVPSDPTAPIGISSDGSDGLTKVDALVMPMQLDLTGRPDWEDVPVLPGTPDKIVKPPKEEAEPELPGTAAATAESDDDKRQLKMPKPNKAVLKAMRDLAKVHKEHGITSTMSAPGVGSATITPESGARMIKNIDKALGKQSE